MTIRYAQLLELEEIKNKAMQTMEYQQLQTKRVFDKKAKSRFFKVGDLVLKWDELKSMPSKHSKFDAF